MKSETTESPLLASNKYYQSLYLQVALVIKNYEFVSTELQ